MCIADKGQLGIINVTHSRGNILKNGLASVLEKRIGVIYILCRKNNCITCKRFSLAELENEDLQQGTIGPCRTWNHSE